MDCFVENYVPPAVLDREDYFPVQSLSRLNHYAILYRHNGRNARDHLCFFRAFLARLFFARRLRWALVRGDLRTPPHT